jgi:SAM-dependent methyltransferase
MAVNYPAFDYDASGQEYAQVRQTDPRIAAYIHKALGDAQTLLNMGAGAGSYEPEDRYVVAIEPSSVMRKQRSIKGIKPAIIGSADAIPFDDKSFDAAMAMVTIHHWPDMQKGLQELRRISRNQVLILTFDPDALDLFWNASYFPELIAVEKARYPSIDFISRALGGQITVQEIAIPLDCSDGFQEAFYGRPEAFLDHKIRKAQSAWSFLPPGLEKQLAERLAKELQSGEWDKKYGHFRTQPTFTGALRLIIAQP